MEAGGSPEVKLLPGQPGLLETMSEKERREFTTAASYTVQTREFSEQGSWVAGTMVPPRNTREALKPADLLTDPHPHSPRVGSY